MKKIYKEILLLIIIQLICILFFNTYVFADGLYSSLEDFVEKNGLENMTGDQMKSKQSEALKKISDENIQVGVKTNAANILSSINGEYDSDKEKMKKLNDNFIQNQGDAYGDPTESDEYYGYILGEQWVIYKKNSEESKKNDESGKTIAEQFDEKYEEYKKLGDKDKKNVDTVLPYYTALQSLYKKLPKEDQTDERLLKLDEVETVVTDNDSSVGDTEDNTTSSPIYKYPSKKGGTAAGSLDDMIGDADKFLNSSAEPAIKSSALQDFSNKFYNIFLTIGIIVAVIVGMVLGIKFMVGGAEEKANIKEVLVPYVVGCIVIFGAFAIWKLVVTILSNSFL